MTEAKPKCRWFRFSLRTLFVLVTIAGACAGWVAYQLNWIRERHAVLQTHGGGELVTFYIEPQPPPWPLGLFGEPSQSGNVFIPFRESELKYAHSLFPEAGFAAIPDSKP
jgi:hypothetical protein